MSFRKLCSFSTILLLVGCASIPQDRGLSDVQQYLDQHGGPKLTAPDSTAINKYRALIKQWLAQPIDAEMAVRIAMVRNPAVREGYADLGIAQAELYDAARLANPTLSAAVLDSNAANSRPQITLGLAQNFANLLLLGPRKRIAGKEVERSKLLTAQNVLNLAADVETAYYYYIGMAQVAQMRQLVADAARISADLATRFYDAGNINRQELQLEQAAATDASIEATLAAARAEIARTELNRLMGLTATESDWKAKVETPLPVPQEDDPQRLLELANSQRMDLQAARQEVVLLEDALGLARSYRYLGSFELGIEYERESDGSRLLGPTLALELPIFNQGEGSVMRALARLEHSRASANQLEIDISNAVSLASKKVAVQRELIQRYQQHLIPQREEVVQRMQELQLFMIVGQFELINAKQQEYDAYQGYIERLRDYWLARVELAREVGAALPSAESGEQQTLDVETLTRPKDSGHQHHGLTGNMSESTSDNQHQGHSMQQADASGHQAPQHGDHQ